MFSENLISASEKMAKLLGLKENGFDFKTDEIYESRLFNMTYVVATYKNQILLTFDDDGRISFYKLTDKRFIEKTISNDYWLITSFLVDSEKKIQVAKQVINHLLSEIEKYNDVDIAMARSNVFHMINTKNCIDNYFNQPLQRIKIKEYDGLELLNLRKEYMSFFTSLKFTSDKVKAKYDDIYGHIIVGEDDELLIRINAHKEITMIYKSTFGPIDLGTVLYSTESQESIIDVLNILRNSVFGNIKLLTKYFNDYLTGKNIVKIEHKIKDLELLDISYELIKKANAKESHKEFLQSLKGEVVKENIKEVYLFDSEILSTKVGDVTIEIDENDNATVSCKKDDRLISVTVKIKERVRPQIEKAIEYLNSLLTFSLNTIDDLSVIFENTLIDLKIKKETE